ncbi:MAG: hypothetical protein Q9165_004938 [Trypethelium subeluteriae]
MNPSQWDTLVQYQNVRSTLVQMAAGRAAQAFSLQNVASGSLPADAMRVSAAIEGYPIDSLVQNITAPMMRINNISWVTGDLPAQYELALNHDHSGLLNFSSLISPLATEAVLYNAALLKDSGWTQSLTNTTFNGTVYAALYVGLASSSLNNSCGQRFNEDLNVARLFNVSMNNNVTSCFKVAEMDINAGVTNCITTLDRSKQCLMNSISGAVQVERVGNEDSYQSTLSSQVEVNPDPFVETAFAMVPEVMEALVATAGPENHENGLDVRALQNSLVYLRSLATISYQGAWSSLAQYLHENTVNATIWPAEQVVFANVARWRVYFWFALNGLVILSGGLLFSLHCLCQRDPLIDLELAAFTLDNSELLSKDTSGLCSATRLGEYEKKLPPLKFEQRHHEDGFHHDVLVFDEEDPNNGGQRGVEAYAPLVKQLDESLPEDTQCNMVVRENSPDGYRAEELSH